MNQFTLVLVSTFVLLAGCSTPELPGTSQDNATKVDDQSTIFGFTPEVRAEMRKQIALQDPSAEVDEVVSQYMQRLEKIAQAAKIKPDKNGNYELPKEMRENLDEWKARSDQEHLPTSFKKIAYEFEVDYPDWILPLLNTPEGKELNPQQEELLLLTVGLELMHHLGGY